MTAAWDFIKASMLSSNLLNFFSNGKFWKEEDGLDWENLVEDWDGENYWESLASENCSGPKRNLADFSNRDYMFASKDYAAAMSRLHSGVPVALAEYEKHGTLQRHSSVPDCMNNQIVNWWWVDLVDIDWLFCF